MIENRLLQYFLAVAEEQSITKAAEYLHITQPTLSKQMMELETSLGRQLLIRGKKKITLTEDGAYLRGKAQEILALMEKTEASLRKNEHGLTGDVYIGCGEYRAIFPIMKIIKTIQTDFPDIHFHFFSGNADMILEKLDKGLLDLGFLLAPEITPQYEYRKLPYQETWGLLLRKDDPLAEQECFTLEELANLPLIMPSQTSNSRRLMESFASNLSDLQIAASYNLIYNAGLMVEAKIGYALCIGGLVGTQDDSLLTFRPITPALYSDIYLFTKKYSVLSSSTKLFLTRLQENILDPGEMIPPEI